jgi:hypothetical protein
MLALLIFFLSNGKPYQGIHPITEPIDYQFLQNHYYNIEKKNLLKKLQGNESVNNKILYIEKFNTDFPDISLSTKFTPIKPFNIYAGNLLDDWNFDI